MLWVNTTATVLRSAIIVLLIQPHHHASGMDIGRALSRSTSSCVLSFLTVPNLKKAVKQSNGHPNMVEQGAAGGRCSMSQHAESTQLLLCFHGFHDLVSNANTDVCVLHKHKRPPQGLQSVSNATKNCGVTTLLA